MNSYAPATVASESVVRSFMGRTYSWMTAGLVLTAVIAYLTSTNPEAQAWARNSSLLLIIVQFGLVMFLSFAIQRINEAEGDVARFKELLIQYDKAPAITKRRLYLETMNQVLPQIGSKIIIDEDAKQFLPLMNLKSN